MIEVDPGISVFPVRTPTLPPATHTNTYILGSGQLTIVDPASPWPDEQERLAQVIETRVASGERVERILLTHHHGDHVSGAAVVQQAWSVPIVAHRQTRELLIGTVVVDQLLDGGDVLTCGSSIFDVHHTPGHAPGHLVFQDQKTKAMVAGDMVAGVGTIAIGPDDGHLGQYLASLQAMRRLKPSCLHPAHGPPLRKADELLAYYIAHRHERTAQIQAALDQLGTAAPIDIVPLVYPELPDTFWGLAAGQILSHLRWLAEHDRASHGGQELDWRLVR
jgi:endoribonuclease LACTB2